MVGITSRISANLHTTHRQQPGIPTTCLHTVISTTSQKYFRVDSKIFECRDGVRGVDMNMAPVSGVVWEDRGRKEGGRGGGSRGGDGNGL